MGYHIDDRTVYLDSLRRRIENTDLVPSRASLQDGLREKLGKLKAVGIHTLADLRKALKTNPRLKETAKAAGLDLEYLTLLRREIEGYFPKPFAFRDMKWLSARDVRELEKNGIRDTADLYGTVVGPSARIALIKSTGIAKTQLDWLIRLSDLTRIQWVSPLAARMLIDAAYDNVKKVVSAKPETLCLALSRVNTEKRYFKGKVGERDVARLIHAAQYVAKEKA